MERFLEFCKEVWIDESDYYGDAKACALYLSFCVLQVAVVIAAYDILGKL